MAFFDGLIALIAVGLTLMAVGFAGRQYNWGVALLAVGTLCMLSTIAYKLYLTFN